MSGMPIEETLELWAASLRGEGADAPLVHAETGGRVSGSIS